VKKNTSIQALLYTAKTLSFLGLFLFFLNFPISAHSQVFESARTAALGTSGRAAPILTDSLYSNPAYMAFLQTYSANFTWKPYRASERDADGNPTRRGRVYGVALQDGRSPLVAGGVGFATGPDDSRLVLGAGKKLGDRFGAGINFRWSFDSPTYPSTQDFSLSGLYVITSNLLVSGGVDQIFANATDSANGYLRSYWLGTKWTIMHMLILYLDLYNTPENSTFGYAPWSHRLGVEIDLGSSVFLRFGQFRNARLSHSRTEASGGYGLGIGWTGPKLALDYGLLRTTVTSIFPQTVAHHFSATLYF
jgi:hypothetical protein